MIVLHQYTFRTSVQPRFELDHSLPPESIYDVGAFLNYFNADGGVAEWEHLAAI